MVPMIAIFILKCRRRSYQERKRTRIIPRRSVSGINTCRSCGMTMFCDARHERDTIFR